MKTLWIDASNGVAGDMLLGALLDAGGDVDGLNRALAPLGAAVTVRRVQRGAFSALKVEVVGVEEATHDHQHSHEHSHGHSHEHVTWASLRTRLKGHERALQVFQLLAEAEAKVHGVPVDEVAFHEVGALDSVGDIVGTCWLLDQLGVDRIVATAPPMGHGFVHTQHGRMALPAPATVACLRGWPLPRDERSGELTTPTGAAVLAALARCGHMPAMRTTATGFGAGTRDPEGWSNTVRVVLGKAEEGLDPTPGRVVELQAQVDDMSGEWLPPLLDRLFEAGALDAFATSVLMKKGRPGLLITVIGAIEDQSALEECLLRHSSTFGVRARACTRRVLERSLDRVQTAYGPIRVKLGMLEGEVLHRVPEHQDCLDASRAHDVSLAEVHRAVLAALPEPS